MGCSIIVIDLVRDILLEGGGMNASRGSIQSLTKITLEVAEVLDATVEVKIYTANEEIGSR